MARKKKGRLLSLKNGISVITLAGTLGGGWFGYQHLPSLSGERKESAEVSAEAETQAKSVHGEKLIGDFAAHQPPQEENAAVGLLASFDTSKKVAPAAFSDLDNSPSGPPKSSFVAQPPASPQTTTAKFGEIPKPPSTPLVEKPENKPPVVANIGDFGQPKVESPKTELPKTELPKTELPKTDPPKTEPPKTAASNTAPVTGTFGDSTPNPPTTNTPSTTNPLAAALANVGEQAKAALTDGPPAPTVQATKQPEQSPAFPPSSGFNNNNAGNVAGGNNTFAQNFSAGQPAANNPPQPKAPFENAAPINSRPPHDPNKTLTPLPEEKPEMVQSAPPRIVPERIDPQTNSQFSSVGSVATGETPAPPTVGAIESPANQAKPAQSAALINSQPRDIAKAGPQPQNQSPPGQGFQPQGFSGQGFSDSNPANNRTVGNAENLQAPPTPRNLTGSNIQSQAKQEPMRNVSTQIRSANEANESNRPGDRALEGVQTPMLSLEKSAPREIQVDRPATFRLIVKNTGRVPAYGVRVTDEVPQGTLMQGVQPNPSSQNGSKLAWDLGTMQPGDVAEITMELLPQQRGEIGSVARVSFESEATVRTVCTKPQLEIQHTTPGKILLGSDILMKIDIRNTGDGAATGVVIEEAIPENMVHADSDGRKLQYPVGALAPGESRQLSLRLRAVQPGKVRSTITASGDGKLFAKDELDVEVVAPKLELAAEGPGRRFLERQAVYDLAVANLGTAAATNVQMVARLPRGLQFVETNKNGQYDPRSHAVYWSILELPPGSKGDVKLTLLPIDVGDQKIEYQTKADLNITESRELIVGVEQISELFFDIDDVADPIEVGSDTVYHVRVVNQGTKPATNVRVAIVLPDGLKAIEASGTTAHEINNNTIVFAPIDRLAANAEAKYEIQVKGQREGDHRVTVQLSSDERRDVVAKEESTKVYSDVR